MQHKKGFVHIILIVIIVLIGIAGVGYYAYKNGQIKIPNQKTNTQTAPDWKSYTNNFLGYTFDYPPDWEVHSIYYNDIYEDGSNQKVDLSQTPYIELSKDDNSFINFKEESYQYKDRGFKENAEQWLTYYLSSTAELGNSSPEVISEDKYAVGDAVGTRYEISYQYQGLGKPSTAVWIYLPLEDKHLLSIKYSSEKSDQSELDEYAKIISTLKFTDNQHADWSKFRKTASKYTINYPNEWSVRTRDIDNSGFTEIYDPNLYSEDGNNSHGSVIIIEYYTIPLLDKEQLTSTEYINGIKLDCKENLPSNIRLDCWTKIPNQDKYLHIQKTNDPSSKIDKVVDQIFSTLKFTE